MITGHWGVQSRGGVSKHGAAPLQLQLYKVILNGIDSDRAKLKVMNPKNNQFSFYLPKKKESGHFLGGSCLFL